MRKNVFTFGDMTYTQVRGTAMGTLPAPMWANLYMSINEDTLLQPFDNNLTFYKRFIDDVLGLWTITNTVKLLPLPQPPVRARTDARPNPSPQRATQLRSVLARVYAVSRQAENLGSSWSAWIFTWSRHASLPVSKCIHLDNSQRPHRGYSRIISPQLSNATVIVHQPVTAGSQRHDRRPPKYSPRRSLRQRRG
jgi:hypothetical protein